MNPHDTTQAVTKVADQKRDIRTLIQSDSVKAQMAMVLPKHLTADRMARVACTTIMRNPKLAKCTPESLLNCLMTCSQFGLEPDGRRAHLIPFENRKNNTVECTLIIDWKGLAELALRSGCIAKLHADLICDKDEFEFDLGDVLHHKINFRAPRGEPYAAWAMAVTKTGEKFVAVLTKDEIEGIRDNSQGWRAFKAGYAKQSPWQDSPGEMWKKTAFRRLSKWLPLSPEFRDAVEADDEPLAKVDTSVLPELPQIEDSPTFVSPPTPASEAKKKSKTKTEPDPVTVETTVEASPEEVKTEELANDDGTRPEPSPITLLLAAMGVAEVTPEQLLAFYNKNKGTELASLAEIPAESIPKLITILSKPDSAQVKQMKGV